VSKRVNGYQWQIIFRLAQMMERVGEAFAIGHQEIDRA
jgi:hypothetical protein